LGSGTKVQDVSQLVNQFRQSQKLLKQLETAKSPKGIMRLFR
jgi:signal recognition particle GTPase